MKPAHFLASAVLLSFAGSIPVAHAVPAKNPAPSRAEKERARKRKEEVRQAVLAGLRYLRNQQKGDGSWEIDNVGAVQPGGVTSLALLALLHAGVRADDPGVEKGLKYLRTLEPRDTYARALQTMVFARAGLKEDRPRIRRNVDWLLKARITKDGKLLGWSYGPGSRSLADNSNTAYAVLGLHAGRLAGARVPREVWRSIEAYYADSQQRGGGWIYTKLTHNTPYLAMTTAGLSGLLVTGTALKKSPAAVLKEKPARRALDWIAAHFTTKLPYRVYYNLHGIHVLGKLSGLSQFGGHDWYDEGCTVLLKEQDKDDGSWPKGGQFDQWPLVNTSFAVLFLVD